MIKNKKADIDQVITTNPQDGSPVVRDANAPVLDGPVATSPLYNADEEKRAAEQKQANELAATFGVGPEADQPPPAIEHPSSFLTSSPPTGPYVGRDVLYTDHDGEERVATIQQTFVPSMQFPAGHVTLAVPGFGEVEVVQPSADGLSQPGRYRLSR